MTPAEALAEDVRTIDQLADLIRHVLVQRVRLHCDPSNPVTSRPVVPLSAGADSTAVLCACDAVDGIEPRAVSFALEGHESTDFEVARENADRLGVPFRRIDLPTDLDHLRDYLFYAIRDLGLRLKTDVECFWPRYVMFRELGSAMTPHLFLTGDGADGYFALHRDAVIKYKGSGTPIDDFIDEYFDADDPAQMRTVADEADRMGHSVRYPWDDEHFRYGFRRFTWDDLNGPRQKEPTRRAFPDRFDVLDVRDHQSFQTGDSLIREHFARLVDTPLNATGGKTAVSVYNSIARGDAPQRELSI